MRLAIDCSSSSLFIACEIEGQIRHEIGISQAFRHDELLALEVNKIFSANPAKILEQVVIAKGPGSFTGLRIALSFAQGLCLARSATLSLVPSFLGLAQELTIAEPSTLLILADARRSEFFYSFFELKKSQDGTNFWDEVNSTKIASLSEIFNAKEFASRKTQGICQVFCVDDESKAEILNFLVQNRDLESSIKVIEGAQQVNFASGLLKISQIRPGQVLSTYTQISTAELDYVRQVAAKTIIERQSLGINK